ncbi:MAG: LuxR C-terminal-related transcriptional regulator [Duodenibacillus sp.]
MTPFNEKSASVRVLIYDQCPLFAEGLKKLLESIEGFLVEVVTDDGASVFQHITDKQLNFVVLDLDAGMPTVKVLEQIKASWLPVRCVMLITDANQPSLIAAIRMQADGFLSKRLPVAAMRRQFAQIAEGEVVISDSLTGVLADSLRNVSYQDAARDVSQISKRELDVLQCLSQGMSNRQISQHLGITDGTVKVHVKHLLKKLNFATRVEAALWAAENGYRNPPSAKK